MATIIRTNMYADIAARIRVHLLSYKLIENTFTISLYYITVFLYNHTIILACSNILVWLYDYITENNIIRFVNDINIWLYHYITIFVLVCVILLYAYNL